MANKNISFKTCRNVLTDTLISIDLTITDDGVTLPTISLTAFPSTTTTGLPAGVVSIVVGSINGNCVEGIITIDDSIINGALLISWVATWSSDVISGTKPLSIVPCSGSAVPPLTSVSTACEVVGDGVATPIQLADTFYDSIDIATVTGTIEPNVLSDSQKEVYFVKDVCSIRGFVSTPAFKFKEYQGTTLPAPFDCENADFVEISLTEPDGGTPVNNWFSSDVTNAKVGSTITIHLQAPLLPGSELPYIRTTPFDGSGHSTNYVLTQASQFYSFTVVTDGVNGLFLKLN